MVDDQAERMFMITSFNEWYEDTQIEPTAGNRETTMLDDSDSGSYYTESDLYPDYKNSIWTCSSVSWFKHKRREATQAEESEAAPDVAFCARRKGRWAWRMKENKNIWLSC